MAAVVHAVGTVANGSTGIIISFPTWTFRNGDYVAIPIVNKYPPNSPGYHRFMPTSPANFQGSGGAGAAGIDTGTVFITWRLWHCRGDESGSSLASIAIPSG